MNTQAVSGTVQDAGTSWGMTAKIGAGFVAGLVVGGVIGWMIWHSSGTEGTTNTGSSVPRGTVTDSGSNTSTNTSTANGLVPDGSFVVSKQKAGDVVAVEKVAFGAGGGWVVIRDDVSGAVGNALGAHWFPEGASTGDVTLLRNTEAGKSYHAILYTDDGNKTFSLQEDKPLLSSVNGKQIEILFTAE